VDSPVGIGFLIKGISCGAWYWIPTPYLEIYHPEITAEFTLSLRKVHTWNKKATDMSRCSNA